MAKSRLITCLIHIPMTYPDQTPIEPETLNEFLEILDRQFGGCSPLGVIDGRWMGIVEPMQRIEVAMPKKDVPLFEKIARQIGRRMRQKEMYVVINYQTRAQCLPIFFEDDDNAKFVVGGAQ